MRVLYLNLLFLFLLAGLLIGGAEGSTPPPKPAPVMEKRSQPLLRWAHPTRRATVYSRPARSGRKLARLRLDTEDGIQEVYLTLSTVVRGGRWVKIRLPHKSNNLKGWVPRSALGPLHRVRAFMVVNRERKRASLHKGGRTVWSAPVGIGAPGTPTPAGSFYIRERLRPPTGSGLYGKLAFGTSAYARVSEWPGGGVVGIHGTDQPGLIPGRPSHGCIRLRARDLSRLARLLEIGTPLRIR